MSRETRVQTVERKSDVTESSIAAFGGSDHITLRRVTDIEFTNEKEGLWELTEQFNQIIPFNRLTRSQIHGANSIDPTEMNTNSHRR